MKATDLSGSGGEKILRKICSLRNISNPSRMILITSAFSSNGLCIIPVWSKTSWMLPTCHSSMQLPLVAAGEPWWMVPWYIWMKTRTCWNYGCITAGMMARRLAKQNSCLSQRDIRFCSFVFPTCGITGSAMMCALRWRLCQWMMKIASCMDASISVL